MKFKITDRAKSEFGFLLNSPLDMIGVDVGVVLWPFPKDEGGFSALECWWAKDTHGKMLPCRDPENLSKAIRSKQSINLQIRLWAEDVADGMLLKQRELIEYVNGWPEWVFRATMEQAAKICLAIRGFEPRFCQTHFVFGNLWFPDMDEFDPSI